jgi:hypothetical protein
MARAFPGILLLEDIERTINCSSIGGKARFPRQQGTHAHTFLLLLSICSDGVFAGRSSGRMRVIGDNNDVPPV